MPGRHHGEAAQRLPQLSRYPSEIPLSGLLLLPQMRFSHGALSRSQLLCDGRAPAAPAAKSSAATVLLGLVCGLGTERMRRRFYTHKEMLPRVRTK